MAESDSSKLRLHGGFLLGFPVDVEEEGMSGLQLFFTLLFSVLGLAVLAVVGLVLYGRWKENKRKRFY